MTSTRLTWQVFVAPSIPVTTEAQIPPGFERRMFSPVSATLIAGEHDAVLVDTLMTVEQTATLDDWVAASGKELRAIYLTHVTGTTSLGWAPFRGGSKGSGPSPCRRSSTT